MPGKKDRVPAVLTLGGCCEAFATPPHEARKDDVEAERFLWAFLDAVIIFRQDPDGKPEPTVSHVLRQAHSSRTLLRRNRTLHQGPR